MPLLKRRALRPRVMRFLARQLDNPEVDVETKAKIERVLDDPKKLEKVNGFAHGLLKKANRLEAPDAAAMAVGTVGGPFIDGLLAFLAEHWQEILQFILSLFV